MSTKLQNLPVYQNFTDEVDIELYRQVRLLLSRRGHSLNIDLPGLRDLRLVLEKDAWICIDTLLDDLPVMAWTGFDKKSVFAQDTNVKCELIYYHSQAAVIVDSILHSLRREMKLISSPETCYIDNVVDMHLAR
jgi:hypothetical protein